jgi:hypothetical protein
MFKKNNINELHEESIQNLGELKATLSNLEGLPDYLQKLNENILKIDKKIKNQSFRNKNLQNLNNLEIENNNKNIINNVYNSNNNNKENKSNNIKNNKIEIKRR